MPPSIEHPCTQCRTTVALRGAQMFAPWKCPACGATSRARDKIGGFQLLEPFARSGLGILFRAVDSGGAPIAVKILRPPFAATVVDVEQYSSATRALTALNHPHCVRILAAGSEPGVFWQAMEWLPGGSLAARLAERGRLPESEVLTIGLQAAAGLGAARAVGLRHGDLEPDSLVFAADDMVKVTDFAQAGLYQAAADDLGTMRGRPFSVSPERLCNEHEDAPSDIYSLGAMLFQALAGTPLHEGEPHGQLVLELIESREFRAEAQLKGLNAATALALNRMLASELSNRAQTWSEVTALLSAAAVAVSDGPVSLPANAQSEPQPARSRRSGGKLALFWTWLTCVLALLALAGGVLAHLRARGTRTDSTELVPR